MSKKTLTPEPLWDGSIDNILICINWYRANASTKQYKKWTLNYIKRNGYSKDDIEAIKACEMIAYSMVGPYCRISTQADIPLPEEGGWQRSLKQYLEILIDEGRKRIDFRSEKKKTELPKPTLSVQEKIENQVSKLIEDLNIKIDNFIDKVETIKKSEYFDIIGWLKEYEVKSVQSKMISEYFEQFIEDAKGAYNKNDEQLIEGYGFLSRSSLKKFIDFVDNISTVCEDYSVMLKKTRKPRTKKKQSPGRLVSKLQYETENTTYDIRSVDPKRIIGASRLVVFNTRYKKLMIFESSPLVDGLSVKGTTIVGFDKKKSKERTVRKPQEMLKDCSTGGIRVINNRYNSLTTKETIPTGRMNKNCVILQVLK